MFSGFQPAFQLNAFQIIPAPANDNAGDSKAFIPSHQLDRIKRDIKKKKTDLDRVESVIAEVERKKSIVIESRILAEQRENLKRAIELEQLENEYLREINRLIMVKAELMRRIRDEETLILIILRKRKLRFAA